MSSADSTWKTVAIKSVEERNSERKAAFEKRERNRKVNAALPALLGFNPNSSPDAHSASVAAPLKLLTSEAETIKFQTRSVVRNGVKTSVPIDMVMVRLDTRRTEIKEAIKLSEFLPAFRYHINRNFVCHGDKLFGEKARVSVFHTQGGIFVKVFLSGRGPKDVGRDSKKTQRAVSTKTVAVAPPLLSNDDDFPPFEGNKSSTNDVSKVAAVTFACQVPKISDEVKKIKFGLSDLKSSTSC